MTDPRRAIVTGASGGLGSAVLALLREQGWQAFGLARTGADLVADVRDPHWLGDAISRACGGEAAGEGLDLLVCCASASVAGHLRDMPADAAVAPLETDLSGAVQSVVAAMPYLRRRPGSTIVFVTSMAALGGVPGFATYSAAKSAIQTFADALRLEQAGTAPAILTLVLGRLDGSAIERKTAWTAAGPLPLRPMRAFRIFRSASAPTPVEAAARTIVDNLGRSGTLYLPRNLRLMAMVARHMPGLYRGMMRSFQRHRLPEMLGIMRSEDRGD